MFAAADSMTSMGAHEVATYLSLHSPVSEKSPHPCPPFFSVFYALDAKNAVESVSEGDKV